MPDFTHNRDATIYNEMLAHPPLFSHLTPQNIAIIGDTDFGITREVLKHNAVTEALVVTQTPTEPYNDDVRVRCQFSNNNEWLNTLNQNHFDILIAAQPSSAECFAHYFNALRSHGILIQLSDSAFEVSALKTIQQAMLSAKFNDAQTLHFPQPNFPSGLRAALMAKKNGIFKKIREKDIFNKVFQTQYYNFDAHKAALALPEFMREELMI